MLEKKISASIMCANFLHLEKDIRSLEKGGCDWLHFDIMDGLFVPNFTLGTDFIKKIRPITKMKFDIHLMITEPLRYISTFVECGADIITVHAEACTHLHRTIINIKEKGKLCGVALNPSTPIEFIKHILKEIDMVLMMTVNPGFSGQKFIPFTVEKVKELTTLLKEKGIYEKVEIQVDGNIYEDTILQLSKAGANNFVAGTSSIFKNNNIYQNTKQLKSFLRKINK